MDISIPKFTQGYPTYPESANIFGNRCVVDIDVVGKKTGTCDPPPLFIFEVAFSILIKC